MKKSLTCAARIVAASPLVLLVLAVGTLALALGLLTYPVQVLTRGLREKGRQRLAEGLEVARGAEGPGVDATVGRGGLRRARQVRS